jgi:hypothetical protein
LEVVLFPAMVAVVPFSYACVLLFGWSRVFLVLFLGLIWLTDLLLDGGGGFGFGSHVIGADWSWTDLLFVGGGGFGFGSHVIGADWSLR